MLFRPQGLHPEPAARRPSSSDGVEGGSLYDAIGGWRRPESCADRRAAAGDDLLETRALRKEFGGLVAVNDVDFTIRAAAIVSLIGPNGAGKTTFFNMLTGLYTPTAGEIVFDGQRRRRPAAAQDHRARHRPHVPEHPPVPDDDRAGERAGGDALPAEGRHRSLRSCGRPGSAARSARPASRRASCCASSGCSGGSTTTTRATCPTATSAGWRSRARWPPTRSCCCSTSRPPA